MLLQKETNQNQILIKGYKNGKINISGESYEHPLVLTASELSVFSHTNNFTELTVDIIQQIIPEGTEIIIIGCGEKQKFLPVKVIKQINELGIAIEVMGTRQACHTFQVLTYEGRKITALLFPK